MYFLQDKRQLLGLMAVILLFLAGLIYLTGLAAMSLTSLGGPIFRAGLVLGAFWLAWPQLARIVTHLPHWLGVGLIVILGVGIVKPRFLLVVVPLVLALWFFGPLLARRFDTKTIVPAPKRRRVRVAKDED